MAIITSANSTDPYAQAALTHEEDRRAPMSAWAIDWFSSAVMFPGWAEYGEEAFLWRGPETYDPLVVYQPRTWLLREGWKKAGAISYRDVPSAKR